VCPCLTILVDDTHSILVQHTRIYRYEISKRQTGVCLFSLAVSRSPCASSPAAAAADFQMQAPCCISALRGLRRCLGLGGPHLSARRPGVSLLPWWARGKGNVRPGPGPGLYRHVPSWPAKARPCARPCSLPELLGSALGPARASGEAGGGMQGSQSKSTDNKGRPGPATELRLVPCPCLGAFSS